MKLNKSPASSRTNYRVSAGGVDGLAVVKESDIGVPNGIPVLGPNQKINPAYLDSGLFEYKPTLDGPLRTMMFAPMNFVITNYSFQRNYRPTTSHGTIEQNGPNVRFVPNISGNVSFMLHGHVFNVFSETEYVQAPTLVGPGENLASPNLRITTSPFQVVNGVDVHESSDWEIALDENFSNLFFQELKSTTNKLARNFSGFLPGTTYYIRARHNGASLGASDWSTPKIYKTTPTAQVFIQKPAIVNPAQNSTTVSLEPTYQSSGFVVSGWEDTFQKTEWELARDANFTDIVERFSSNTDQTNWSPSKLVINSVYYLRVRHFGVRLGSSQWSDPTLFRTVNLAVSAPSVTEPISGSTDVPVNPMIRTSAPRITGSITHVSTDWQISTDPNFGSFALNLAGSPNLVALQTTGLIHDTQYYVRVRYNMTEGVSSPWSTVSSFKLVRMSIETPSITAPTANATNIGTAPNFTSSAFRSTGGVTHESSTWEVSKDSSFGTIIKNTNKNVNSKVSWSTSGLELNTQYYVRVKFFGSSGIESAWSQPIGFRTLSASINKPRITSHLDGARIMAPATFTSSAFSATSGVTHTSSTWHIARDTGFSWTHERSVESASNKTSWPMSTKFQNGVTYYIYVIHHGTIGGVTISSPRSDTISFVGAALAAPTITNPTAGSSNFPLYNGEFRCTAFEGTGHQRTDYQIRVPSQNYAGVVFPTSGPGVYNRPAYAGQWSGVGQELVVRARHVVNNEAGPWSAEVSYRNENTHAYVAKPYIVSPSNGGTVGLVAGDVQVSPFTGQAWHSRVQFQVAHMENPYSEANIFSTAFRGDWVVPLIGWTYGAPGNSYRVRVRHIVNNSTASEWSNEVVYRHGEFNELKAGVIAYMSRLNATLNELVGLTFSGSMVLQGITPAELGWGGTVVAVIRRSSYPSMLWVEKVSASLTQSGGNTIVNFTKSYTLPTGVNPGTRATEIYNIVRDNYHFSVDLAFVHSSGWYVPIKNHSMYV